MNTQTKEIMASQMKAGDVMVATSGGEFTLTFTVTEVKLTKTGRVNIMGTSKWTNIKTGEVTQYTKVANRFNGAQIDFLTKIYA